MIKSFAVPFVSRSNDKAHLLQGKILDEYIEMLDCCAHLIMDDESRSHNL